MKTVLCLNLLRLLQSTDVLTSIRYQPFCIHNVCKRQFTEEQNMADGGQAKRENTFLVVGLGNHDMPGTRHSVGMEVTDKLSQTFGVRFKKEKACQSMIAKTVVSGVTVILAKPRIPMNLNGIALGKSVKHYNIDNENIILVHDNLDQDVGKVTLKKNGGTANGHNGVKSVAMAVPSGIRIPRVLIGIDRPASRDREEVVNHVLGKFTNQEQKAINKGIEKAIVKIMELISEKSGIDISTEFESGKDTNNNELT